MVLEVYLELALEVFVLELEDLHEVVVRVRFLHDRLNVLFKALNVFLEARLLIF